MKYKTNLKRGSKFVALAMSAVLSVGAFALAGCTPGVPGEPVTPPAAEYQVYFVSLQHNGADVDGQLAVDLSMGTVALTADVLKDYGSTATVAYSSSDSSVATIAQDGTVTLVSTGETIISATVGDKSHSIVLVVGSTASVGTYPVTVTGGVAKNQDGQVVTQAREGDYLTLVPSMPEHKDFVQWNFDDDDLWINGNVIKMPAQTLTVSAEYTDTLYKLNLMGAKVAKANLTENPEGEFKGGSSVETTEYEYEFAYGTTLKIKANDVDNNKMFVGWDLNAENNRVGKAGVTEYTFEMKGEETTLTAIYGATEKNILPGANVDGSGKPTSKFNDSESITSKKITAGVIEGATTEDADLQGLYGYSLAIKGNVLGSTSSPENIQKSDLNTFVDLEPRTVKVIMKNRGAYAVTVELGYSYFGNMGSTGVVTVPAGGVVTSVFEANMGLNDCSWFFAVREAIGASESDIIDLDVVAAAAQTYPHGYPLLKGGKNAQYVNFSGVITRSTGWKNGGNQKLYNQYGAQLFVSRASNMSATSATAYAKISNLPAYDASNPTTTIYVQVFSLVNDSDNPKNKMTIAVSTSNDGLSTTVLPLASAEVNITQPNQIILIKLEVPRTASQTTLYVNFVKNVKEEGQQYNFLAQFAYNNVFGYEE